MPAPPPRPLKPLCPLVSPLPPQVTLIPRGQAQGLTWFTPTDELNLLTRQQVFAAIVGALGGRAAEEVVYGRMETTSGVCPPPAD